MRARTQSVGWVCASSTGEEIRRSESHAQHLACFLEVLRECAPIFPRPSKDGEGKRLHAENKQRTNTTTHFTRRRRQTSHNDEKEARKRSPNDDILGVVEVDGVCLVGVLLDVLQVLAEQVAQAAELCLALVLEAELERVLGRLLWFVRGGGVRIANGNGPAFASIDNGRDALIVPR